jgi:hypothetical protein
MRNHLNDSVHNLRFKETIKALAVVDRLSSHGLIFIAFSLTAWRQR